MKPFFSKLNCPAVWIALGAFTVTLFTPGIFHDGDTYWHIATGRWMLDNKAILRIDPFSLTMAGHAWQTHEWLSEVLMALSYVGLGWNGVALFFAAVFALTAGLLTRHLGRYLHGPALVVTAVLALSCIAGSLLARPHILALPCLELWIAGLLRARDNGRAPHWSLIFVMVLWANLHDSFLIGLILTLLFGLEAITEGGNRRESARKWGRFLILAILAALCTPYGVYAFTFPFALMGMTELYNIREWMPLKISLTSPFLISAALALYMLLSRGARVRALRLVILIGLAYLSLSHVRHLVITAIIAPFLIAGPLAATLRQPLKPAVRAKHRLVQWAGCALCLILLTGARFAFPLTRENDTVTPGTALTHVPEALRHQPVFNSYDFGGYLIFQGVAPFIDGRAELYGENFLQLYDRITAPGSTALENALNRYHIRWAIVVPQQAVTDSFRALPGWHETYHDSYAVVFVKGNPPS